VFAASNGLTAVDLHPQMDVDDVVVADVDVEVDEQLVVDALDEYEEDEHEQDEEEEEGQHVHMVQCDRHEPIHPGRHQIGRLGKPPIR
jgi:hypothetical protein